ncbi:F390 synthetase-related protein [Saccharospirillum mangrovi]|uniref:F390 synthetase-related protein n=1 Tax=Saccharospirillum mangrovi TaxID=2161747 RepID=UPI000D335E28|nr:F390 synthetase-related protein [Saccharospirillum mangrovi]
METLGILRHFLATRWRHFPSRPALEDWQQKQLKRHLNWVCRHSPLYRDFLGKPLDEFPLMNKATMMAQFDQLNTRGLRRDELFDLALNAEKTRDFSRSNIADVTVGLSSGTSGQRGLFIVSRAERLEWAGTIFAKLLPTLRQPQRIALLLRADSSLYQTVHRGRIQFHYVDLSQPPEQWLESLERFQPTILVGSAQALQWCARNSERLAPNLVVSGAEVLTPTDRALLQQRFNCPINEIYQCTEGFLACTQRDGVLRWNEDAVHIEPKWLNAAHTHFSPIITDFRRRTQPIIRYQLDDVIEVGNMPGVFQSIGNIGGRCGDLLQLPGADITVTIMSDLIYRAIALASAETLDYRISQLSAHRLRIESNAQHSAIEQALTTLFRQQGALGSLEFEHAPAPVWQATQKQRRVVNAWTS